MQKAKNGRNAAVLVAGRRRARLHGHRLRGRGGARPDRPARSPGAGHHALRRRSSPASRCRRRSPSRATSPSGTSTCSGCWSARSAPSSTSPGCGGCTSAATRGRGTARPLWLLGLALLFYITNGGVNVYEKYLFSAHMLGHMVLGMMVPVLLVPAAPITLALRAIAKRTTAAAGPREWILLAVHSKVAGDPRQPDRRGRALRRLAVGVLLHAAVPLGDHRPHRAHLDGRALPDRRLPVRPVADRHRPGAVPGAVPDPPDRAAGDHGASTPSSASP